MSGSDPLAADRDALRQIVEAYARTVDRRRPQETAELFAVDGVLEIYDGDPEAGGTLQRDRTGREQIAAAMERLSMYEVTTHFLGQHMAELDGDHATGETYCLAHHITRHADGKRTCYIMSIRYLDDFRRDDDGVWRIAKRRLAVDWTDDRPLPTPET